MRFLMFASLQLTYAAALGQTQFSIYTGISGYYDYQTNYRTPQYIRACPGTSYIHAIMMVADDSSNISTSRRTAYAFSSNSGTTWNTFSNLRVPSRRSGFPSLDIAQGSFANAAVVVNHNAPTTGLQSMTYVDYPIGSGAFSELNPPVPLGGDEPIFPEVAAASDGSIILIGSRAAGTTTHLTRTSDLTSWAPWSLVTADFISDGYVAEGNTNGRVGIVIGAPSSALEWLESTNNGISWPASSAQLLPEHFPAGNDSFAITPGLDLVYNTSDTLIAFGVTKLLNGNPTQRFSGIGFYSRRNGFVLAVPHDSVVGVVDTLLKPQVNQFPVGYPAIGTSGSSIVIAFQAFKPETSQAGFNYADVFFVHSSNGGRNWSRPVNLTNTPALDERYPSMSKWNAPGQANIVFQEDSQPGSGAFGNDRAPISRNRQRYCRVSGLSTSSRESEEKPVNFRLYQNFPNPFNPTTTIRFEIPHSSFVTLKVFDLLGREVATLVNEEMGAGRYERVLDGSNLASGIYFYHLGAGDFAQTKKLVLLR